VKERLTGAIILVALIVLLVPELLTGPVRSAAGPPFALNLSEVRPLRSYTINLADDPRTRTQASGGSGPSMPQPSGPIQPTIPIQSGAVAQPGGATQQDEAAQPRGSAQVGAASQSRGSAQPKGAAAPNGTTPANGSGRPGIPDSSAASDQPPATVKPGDSSSVPPSAKQSAANPTRSRTATRARSSEEAARTAPTSPPRATSDLASRAASGAWIVQLGVFANRENAEHLAQELRVKGFKASVADVTSGSRKLFRVRVGPAADRTAAQDLQNRLRASGRTGTVVVPAS
jgi:DedD protein